MQMPTKTHQKPVTELFYEAVRKEFSKLSEIKELGVKKYSNDYILVKLAKMFVSAPPTPLPTQPIFCLYAAVSTCRPDLILFRLDFREYT